MAVPSDSGRVDMFGRQGLEAMQQVIEEILKTEEDCAQRLEEERKATAKRRNEIETANAERVRAFRERAEREAATEMREFQERVSLETQAEIARVREHSERQLASNQTLLDRIVERIVELVIGNDR